MEGVDRSVDRVYIDTPHRDQAPRYSDVVGSDMQLPPTYEEAMAGLQSVSILITPVAPTPVPTPVPTHPTRPARTPARTPVSFNREEVASLGDFDKKNAIAALFQLYLKWPVVPSISIRVFIGIKRHFIAMCSDRICSCRLTRRQMASIRSPCRLRSRQLQRRHRHRQLQPNPQRHPHGHPCPATERRRSDTDLKIL
ncbi:unnamed protein product [Trichogramma brassicae]|uniref:Uncharacterized protein n=1 Tax=Trichogramma brassicae TaxID=86971 RepID=A0A6H5J637_9HYME|nr:unnamed protein product [Trichogramma brassicae]